MPRTSLRAACAVLALLSLLLAATPTSSMEEHWPDRPGLFGADPSLLAYKVAECPGTSPMQNACEAYPDDSCASICYPDVAGGFGYTGRVTGYVYGKSSRGQDVYMAYSCGFLASSKTKVGPVDSGGCSEFGTAERICLEGNCEYRVMWPPFRLRGESGAGLLGAGPAGSWVVRLYAN